jgi:hypothetical protein
MLWGTGTGSEDASVRFGTSCLGRVGVDPNHTFRLEEAATVSINVASDGDLVMVVDGPAGTFCSDDAYGLDPAVSENLTPGIYEIYVGEFTDSYEGTPYTGSITATAYSSSITPEWSVDPDGILLVDNASETREGTAGGVIAARSRWPGCSGHVGETPNFVLDVRSAQTFEMLVQSEGDTTLIVIGPGVLHCDDDTYGSNPAVTAYLEAGQYQVYVGSYSRSLSHPFRFVVQAVTSLAAPR